MPSLETPVCDFGAKPIDFSLPGIDGKVWTLDDCKGEKGLLVMFICNHCPYVKAVVERIVRDVNRLAEYGISSVAIMPNDTIGYPQDSFENMAEFSNQHQFSFPYLIDDTQDVARAYGAVCTPDFFGYNNRLELQYRGRLDASRKETAENAQPELFDAMKQVAQSGHGPKQQIPSMGCSIKWRDAL
ncbi:MAG: thioredoxin family protein [Gammaproteobacteria bacterium]|nr:thioredoxin family protein [Gammaproteobacteria bacterium]